MVKLNPVLTIGFAVALAASFLTACAVDGIEEGFDPAASESSLDTDEAEAVELAPRDGRTCDDFDSFCVSSDECADGFVCRFDPDHCGSNFFGTFPNCGVTAACLPRCLSEIQP